MTGRGAASSDPFGPRIEEPDLRAEDDALVAAALDAEPEESPEEDDDDSEDDGDAGDEESKRPRRRGRRGGRGRRRGTRRALEGTFDHGEEGYGLWLDPSVQDDAVYAEYWAGHRPITVTIEQDQIVIRRAGADDDEESEDSGDADAALDPDRFDT